MVQLRLSEVGKREVLLADGRNVVVPHMGPVQIGFEDRTCFTGALVLGDSVMMGAVPMDDKDLAINPFRRTVTPNSVNPNIPYALVK